MKSKHLKLLKEDNMLQTYINGNGVSTTFKISRSYITLFESDKDSYAQLIITAPSGEVLEIFPMWPDTVKKLIEIIEN